MYVNCVYCGHRYGPNDEVPVSMAEALREHIEECAEHPMSKLKEENRKLKDLLRECLLDYNDDWMHNRIKGALDEGALDE